MHMIVLECCLASAIGYSPNSIFEIPYAAHNNAAVIQMGELARVTDERRLNQAGRSAGIRVATGRSAVNGPVLRIMAASFWIQMSKKRREMPRLSSMRAQ